MTSFLIYRQMLPAAIVVPLLHIASYLGVPPTATYSALDLWNFTAPLNSDLSQIENLSVLHTFTGTMDEAWFYLISVAIEARGAEIIPVMLRAIDAARAGDSQLLVECLLVFADSVKQIGIILERMYEKCRPEVFYHQIRPFLAGSKNMSAAGLPNGVFYDEGYGQGKWRQYSGGSNAQSSLIQFFDIVLGVEHSPTRNSKVVEGDLKAKHGFLQVQVENSYHPASHPNDHRKCETTCQEPTAAFFSTWKQSLASGTISKHLYVPKMPRSRTISLSHGWRLFETFTSG